MKTEEQKPSNPSAFPVTATEQSFFNQSPLMPETGMTLRDYFATASIQGILSSQTALRSNGAQNNHFNGQIKSLCKEAYEIADEMLKQR